MKKLVLISLSTVAFVLALTGCSTHSSHRYSSSWYHGSAYVYGSYANHLHRTNRLHRARSVHHVRRFSHGQSIDRFRRGGHLHRNKR